MKNENSKKRRTYSQDSNFITLINQLKDLKIHINQDFLNRFYENLKDVIDLNEDETLDLTIPRNYYETYFLNLAIRELGRRTNSYFDKVSEPLSNDISTIYFEDYLAESTENTLANILNEIKRITKNEFDYKLINEIKYDETEKETGITIEYIIDNKTYKLTHDNRNRKGTLLSGFLTDELLPTLNNSIKKGHLLYFSEETIHFIYFENKKYFKKFIKTLEDYNYVEIESKITENIYRKFWSRLKKIHSSETEKQRNANTV